MTDADMLFTNFDEGPSYVVGPLLNNSALQIRDDPIRKEFERLRSRAKSRYTILLCFTVAIHSFIIPLFFVASRLSTLSSAASKIQEVLHPFMSVSKSPADGDKENIFNTNRPEFVFSFRTLSLAVKSAAVWPETWGVLNPLKLH